MSQVFHSVKKLMKNIIESLKGKKNYGVIRERGAYYPETPGKSNLWKNDF